MRRFFKWLGWFDADFWLFLAMAAVANGVAELRDGSVVVGFVMLILGCAMADYACRLLRSR